ncbi:MAG: hypothetical protein ACYDBH_15770, partial [Acidobacteriaceae bacterium]
VKLTARVVIRKSSYPAVWPRLGGMAVAPNWWDGTLPGQSGLRPAGKLERVLDVNAPVAARDLEEVLKQAPHAQRRHLLLVAVEKYTQQQCAGQPARLFGRRCVSLRNAASVSSAHRKRVPPGSESLALEPRGP